LTRIAVTGIWHQGMVLAAGLADLGHEVVGLTEREAALRLSSGEPLVHEPGLGEVIRRNLHAGRLRFVSDPAEALQDVGFAYMSSDTPVDDRDVPQLEDVFALAETVKKHTPPDAIMVVTAQVPVGTTERLGAIAGRRTVYVPEFLQLGVGLSSFVEADRIVIGADGAVGANEVAALYAPLGRPLVRTSIRTAELAKHASNAFLATSISLVNELGDIAAAYDADVDALAAIMKLDRRIGPHAYLAAGIGFAGATLGRDLRALQDVGAAAGIRTSLIDAVVDVNGRRSAQLIACLERELVGLDARRIAILGLTYKAGTSTLRRAISLEIARELAARGASIAAFDPLAELQTSLDLPALELRREPIAAAAGADAVVYLTGWDTVAAMDLSDLQAAMRGELLVDTRGDIDPSTARAAGLRYLRVPGSAS
jgi:UDPglucose 6-dehydrogenase